MKKFLMMAALVGAVLSTACQQSSAGISMGSVSSEMDSLSYAMGAYNAYGIAQQMGDIPFDFKALDKGIVEGALDKKSAKKYEDAINTLREYFFTKRPARADEIMKKHAEADSIRLASGDSTKVEYPIADPEMFESEQERTEVSYAFGQDIGHSMRTNSNQISLQLTWVLMAMQDVRDENPKMSQEECGYFLQHYFMVTLPEKNRVKAEEWLNKIEKKSGVMKTESGLLYKIKKAGDPDIKATDSRDVVKVHYTGRTREGKVFDSSIFKNRPKEQQEAIKKHNPEAAGKSEPVEFPLNRVIRGWTEGLQLIGKGGRITLWIPAELAYGRQGAGELIGPNDALEFEVELLDVTPYEQPAPEPAEETEEGNEAEESAE